MSERNEVNYVLPASLVHPGDLSRLIRELETIDGVLQAQKVRGVEPHLPPLSQGLEDFAEQNKVNLADDHALNELKEHLRMLKNKAPVVHLTFASDADAYSLQKITEWLRQEVNPLTLVTVGVQPALVGGVYLRTPDHVHDFSLKALLHDKRGIIVKELEALRAG